jgi:hypothetical protein
MKAVGGFVEPGLKTWIGAHSCPPGLGRSIPEHEL